MSDDIEVWIPVLGYESLYSVSSDGRIRSEPRTVVRRTGSYQTKARILVAFDSPEYEYSSLKLTKNGISKTEYVHQIVTASFHGPRPTGHDACHGDGNSKNNHQSNLRWATPLENHADKHLHGTSPVGERHAMAKLTDKLVIALRSRRLEGASFATLANEFGVTTMTAYRAATGQSWSHIP